MSTPPTVTAGEPGSAQGGRGAGTTPQAGGPLGRHRGRSRLPPTPRTPLHCAASCNDTAICTALVQHGAAIFATTISDGATAIEKCDPYREGYADCATYLAGARLAGTLDGGLGWATFGEGDPGDCAAQLAGVGGRRRRPTAT